MRLQILVWTLVVGLTGGVVAIAAPKGKAAKGPKEVEIKTCQKAKPPVKFTHEAHVKLAKANCKSCHHTGDNAKACGSAGCHAGKAEGKKLGCAEMSLTKNPYHVKCVSCHKKEGKGPKGCADCHKK